MQFEPTDIDGVYIIETKKFEDLRGTFIKTFHDYTFAVNDKEITIKESYYSTSAKDVIRGMHFQLPPKDHAKLVYVPYGEIIDVVLDLRKSSISFGRYISLQLSGDNGKSIFIPKGCAHGFKSLKDGTVTVYSVTSEYDNLADSGIKWDSFEYDWGIKNPIVSERDSTFQAFLDFQKNNPF